MTAAPEASSPSPLAAPAALAAHASPSAHPASSASNFSGPLFFNTTSGFAVPPVANDSCDVYSSPYYYDSYCYVFQQQPTLLTLPNGDVGVGFSATANTTSLTCPVTPTYYGAPMGSEVGFSVSTDNGTSFASPVWIGGDSCAYPSSVEPTFALGTGGTIYGAYVAANYTFNPTYWSGYADRTGDALAFVTSTDSGASFSDPIYLDTNGNVSYPVMAAVGDTVYIVYENVSNGTTPIATTSYYTSYPPELEFIVSTDGGSTWSTPQILPGQNSTASYLAMSPSIALSSDGEVAVAYATNYSCVAYCGSFYQVQYALDIVLITSTNNGTTWTGPMLVSSQAGSTPYGDFSWYDTDWLWQFSPVTQVAFSPDGSSIYVAWTASYNTTGGTYGWGNDGMFAAVSTDGGATWTLSTVGAQFSVPSYNQDSWTHPGLGVGSDGTVYLTYLWQNNTYGYSCGSIPDFLDQLKYQVLSTSADGVHWAGPVLVGLQSDIYDTYTYGWGGWTSSVGFTEAGSTLLAYSQPQAQVYSYNYWGGVDYYNATNSHDLEVASVYSGPTVTVEFNASGLPAGQPWTAIVSLTPFTTTEASMNISGIPLGVNVYVNVAPFVHSVLGSQQFGTTNFYSWQEWGAFYSFTEINVTFADFWPFYLYSEPANVQDMYMTVYFGSQCGELDEYGGQATYNPPLPWWIPNGTFLYLSPSSYDATPPVVYWNGSGNNSYTGPGTSAFVEVSGSPLTETFWMAYETSVNQTIVPVGLPSTSVYSFEFDGSTYSDFGTTSTTIYSIVVGPHAITQIEANSSVAGYEYFGYASSGPVVDAPMDGIVYLHFALVDTTSTSGTVSFQESGLDVGTTWYLSFNGTTLSSNTSWENVTAMTGTYDVSAAAGVAPSAQTSWVASGFGPQASVSAGATVTVPFSPTYRFSASASVGGTIAGPSTLWVLPGTIVNVNATPAAGYRFVGWTGTGVGSYTGTVENITVSVGGPVSEGAAFSPLPNARFNVTFNETGLPAGQAWTVVVGGSGHSSTTGQIVVPGLLATTGSCTSSTPTRYSLSVPYAYAANAAGIRYVPGSYPSGVCTNGFTVVSLTFSVQYELTLQATVGGMAVGYSSSSPGPSSALWVAPTDAVTISAFGFTGYTFIGWQGTGSGSYTGTVSIDTLSATGPVNEVAVFQPVVVPAVATFTASFHEQVSLASGTTWMVTLGSKSYASTTPFLNVTGLVNGSYTLSVATVVSPDGLTQYAPTGAPTLVKISGSNQTIAFAYATSYWVSVTSNVGGAVRPASMWIQSGGAITINATAQEGYTFAGWVGTGAGSYTGSSPQVKVTVNNSLAESARFAPVAASVGSSGGGTGFWASSAGWIAFGLIGLVVGLVVGLLLLRSRAPPNAPSGAGAAETEPPYAESGESSSPAAGGSGGGNP